MKPNPGGIITGDAIIDREIEITSIWNALQNQSVVLTSERRVGKTSVLRKMQGNPIDGWTPILFWVEGKWHPIEFVEGLYDLLLEESLLGNEKFHRLKKLYAKYIGGTEIGSWKLPQIKENWKTLLESLIEDINNGLKKVLIMLDELPLMISHFQQASDCGPDVSMEFLDTLREIRNKYEASKNIAFIFCGSIGIHLVIKDLKRNYGYNADPINNMKICTLSGMDESGAKLLCEKLLEGETYQFDDKDEAIDYLCKRTDNLPFYIHHVFAFFEAQDIANVDSSSIDEAVDYLLNDPNDEGFFRHYIDRIKTYYDKDLGELALLILDKACKTEHYWKEGDIIKTVRAHSDIDNETIKETLNLLWSDHYLVRTRRRDSRLYKFKYDILQNWWKVNRG